MDRHMAAGSCQVAATHLVNAFHDHGRAEAHAGGAGSVDKIGAQLERVLDRYRRTRVA